MTQLFKLKSLKKTQKTGEGANNKNAKKQCGRSMVEMLGVLAIIGVLSIGGIQGYTLAMRKYQANEILNIVQKYAMVIYSGCQQAIEKNPERYTTNQYDETDYGKNFWACPGIEFTDAGLGALPNGVLKIADKHRDPYVSFVNYMGNSGITIKSLSSGDAVSIRVQFRTKELCETVMSITGKPTSAYDQAGLVHGENDYTCGNGNIENLGSYHNDEYYLVVTTMMN